MNKPIITLTLGLAGAMLCDTASACTSLIAAKNATTDGSVFLTYAADSHTLYGELYSRAATTGNPKGTMREVIEWDTARPLGKIPQPSETYATVGNMNEHGVAIVESTWGGRKELDGEGKGGLIDYGSLIYIALERAKTAREALDIMTSLANEYGYASSGESFTIGDGNEVWILELIGKGDFGKGVVWVACRIPDDCISGHANHPRIHKFPLKDKKNCLYSPDVIKFARERGYFNGRDEDFSFSTAYAPIDFGAVRGCDARVWAYFNKYASGMDKYLPWVMEGKGEPLPLYVKPDKEKLNARKMQWMMRDHFEDTPMDMTVDVGAGPFKVPYRWRPMDFTVDSVEYVHERAIATQQTGFSLVAQLNTNAPEPMKGILWFGTDDANTSVYVPFFNSTTRVPEAFAPGNGDMYNISWTSSFWVNNYVANQAYNRYSAMIGDIRNVQNALEDRMEQSVDSLRTAVAGMPLDEAKELLNATSEQLSADYVKRYKELGDYLLVKYLDGNIKKERDGKFARTQHGIPESPTFGGYDDPRYFRSIVNDAGEKLRVKF